jgi:hypothetical protein
MSQTWQKPTLREWPPLARKAAVRPSVTLASGGELAQPNWENHDIEV